MGRQDVWSQRVVLGLCASLLALFGLGAIGVSSTEAASVTATLSVGNSPYAIGVDTANGSVYVANKSSGTVSVITESDNVVGTPITVGSDPEGVGVDSSTNMIYVANEGSNSVSVITGTANTVATIISMGFNNPIGVGVDSTTGTVYVANDETSGTVSVVSESSDTVTATVNVGSDPIGLGVDSTTGNVYVANEGSGTVSVINGSSVTATINVGSGPNGVAVDAGTDMIYVTNEGSGTVSVINGSNNTVTATIGVESSPTGVAVDASTDTIYVGNSTSNIYISLINGSTNAVTSTVAVGLEPNSVAVDPSSHKVYVANDETSGTVSVVTPASTTPSLTAVGPGTGTAGIAITTSSIIAELASGSSPTGTIIFTVFGPQATAPTVCTTGGTYIATVSVYGNGNYEPSVGYTPPSIGYYWWYASYSGDGNNNASASTCGSSMPRMIVSQGSSPITWSTPSAITYGTALSATQLDATSPIAGTFVYSPVAGTVLGVGVTTLAVTFTPTDTTDYVAVTTSVSLTVNPAPLKITASSTKMTHGAKPPTVKAIYTGFVNGNSASSLSTKPTCVTKATKATKVGTDKGANTCSGAVDPDYSITYFAGNVTVVGPAVKIATTTLTITARTTTTVELTCSLATCRGTLSISEHKGVLTIMLGGTTYAISRGTSAIEPITLNATGRLVLGGASLKTPLAATVEATVNGGKTVSETAKIV